MVFFYFYSSFLRPDHCANHLNLSTSQLFHFFSKEHTTASSKRSLSYHKPKRVLDLNLNSKLSLYQIPSIFFRKLNFYAGACAIQDIIFFLLSVPQNHVGAINHNTTQPLLKLFTNDLKCLVLSRRAIFKGKARQKLASVPALGGHLSFVSVADYFMTSFLCQRATYFKKQASVLTWVLCTFLSTNCFFCTSKYSLFSFALVTCLAALLKF